MKIYIVLWQDRHTDTTAKPFVSLDEAIRYARISAADSSRQFPEDYKESYVGGWLFHVQYSCEGDHLWITEHEI